MNKSASNRRQVLGTTLLGACALSMGLMAAPAMAQGNAKVLSIGMPFSPLSMDPSISGNGRAGVHLSPAYEPLLRTQADGKFAPGLATAWQLSADSKEATFTLRQNAKFSDGEPVTAEAVKKSLEYFVGKKGPFAANFSAMTGIEVLDKFKFKVKLSVPQPALLSLFDAYFNSGDIISPKALDNPAQLASATFGAGPYKLDTAATITGKSYTYVPNEHYYDKSRVKWDKVVVQVFEDQNAGIQAMKAGQLKVLVSDPFTGNANAANLPSDLRIVSDPVQWTGLVLADREGVFQPELKDVRVRQAINYALDRKLISTALFGKMAEPTAQLQSKGFLGYDPEIEKRYPYNPEKAKALLAEAGYPNGFELKLQYVNNTLSRFLTMAIAGQLKKVGIRPVTEEFQNFGAMLAAERSKKIGALMFNSNSGVPNLARFQTLGKGSLNFYKTEDATLTKLMDEAALLPLDKAEAAWKKVYAHAAEIAWFAPVVASHTVYFASSSVKMPRIGQSIVVDVIDMVPAK
ncbi:MAG: ABC transporter substrate-binding protein [Limnohabitans sp.]|jgi:peptide/nickel transport system substrate-binding protein